MSLNWVQREFIWNHFNIFQIRLIFLLEPLFLLIFLDYSDARNQLLLMDNDDTKVTEKYLKIIIVVCNVIIIL